MMERRKMLQSVILAAVVIIIIICVLVVGKVVDKSTPSEETMDIYEYFHLTDESKAAIVKDRECLEQQAVMENGTVYLEYNLVKDAFNDRFYYDKAENILLYTTPTDVVRVSEGENTYLVSAEPHSEDYVIFYTQGEQLYVALEYVKKYTNLEYTFFTDPNVVVITTDFSKYTSIFVEKATQLRYRGGIKSPILKELEAGEELVLLEEGDDWNHVMSREGILGYVMKKYMGEITEQKPKHKKIKEEFSHILRDGKITMAWHQVMTAAANDTVREVVSNTKGLNVISPTWFYVNDNAGNLVNLCSASYVEYCHNQGIEVWALINNLENEEVDSTEVLNRTSIRAHMIDQLITAAIEYNLDGINVDFESLQSEAGEGYIQFIRELSLKCEEHGIILSVDNYVPTEYTAFYNRKEQANFADYVIIMGYDEHYVGSNAGSVASIGFVENGVKDTLKEVPAEQTILAAPLYTRIWCETLKEGVVGDSAEAVSEDYNPFETTSQAVGREDGWLSARAHGVEPVWLEEEGQYYAEYKEGEATYKIWLEDTKSMALRLQVVTENDLAGVSFWKLGFEESSFWDTVLEYIP